MIWMSIAGVLLTLVLAWRVPQLFHEMPASLHRDARISLLFVGISLSFGLLCSVYSAIFLRFQRSSVPMVILIINRVLFTAVICSAMFFHSSLALMGLFAAVVNVNVVSSIYLAHRIGAAGVAIGTLLGSFVSVTAHFAFNMRYTYSKFSISRVQLLVQGVLRPGMIVTPSLLLFPFWRSTTTNPSFHPWMWATWAITTLLVAWFGGLTSKERTRLVGLTKRRMKLSTSYS